MFFCCVPLVSIIPTHFTHTHTTNPPNSSRNLVQVLPVDAKGGRKKKPKSCWNVCVLRRSLNAENHCQNVLLIKKLEADHKKKGKKLSFFYFLFLSIFLLCTHTNTFFLFLSHPDHRFLLPSKVEPFLISLASRQTYTNSFFPQVARFVLNFCPPSGVFF